MNESIAQLHDYLQKRPPGNLSGDRKIQRLLAECWDDFVGSGETKMNTEKLDRAEDLRWDPPELSFRIERHGGTVKGSSRAEVHFWSINIETLEARCIGVGHRQVRPMDKKLNVERLAAEIADLIANRKQDKRLKWVSDGRVRVLISSVIRKTNSETTRDRRKRFRQALDRLLAPTWEYVPVNVYRRSLTRRRRQSRTEGASDEVQIRTGGGCG